LEAGDGRLLKEEESKPEIGVCERIYNNLVGACHRFFNPVNQSVYDEEKREESHLLTDDESSDSDDFILGHTLPFRRSPCKWT
jgi:hypothetical protein